MSADPATLHLPRQRLLLMTVSALLFATLIVVCFVLPAEFRIDPTGVGKLTGVAKLAGPRRLDASVIQDVIEAGVPLDAGAGASNEASPHSAGNPQGQPGGTRYYAGGYRSDFVEIPLAVAGSATRGEELEYKVRMRSGGTLAYSWTVSGIENPEEFYYDFHGESPSKSPDSEPTVIEYRQATGTHSHGTLLAPFDGIFGWYLQNQSEHPVVVHLRISGFYDLVPPGEYGNEAGIEANQPLPAQGR
jgi:hypothetical protein